MPRRAPSRTPRFQSRPRSSSASVRRHVVLQVAGDDDLAGACIAQPLAVAGRLREGGDEARERRPQQGVDAGAAAPAARAEAGIGEEHRHAGALRFGEQVGPDLGLEEHAHGRLEMAQETTHATGCVEGQPGLHIAGPQQRSAGGATGRGAVREQQAKARARGAHRLDQRHRGAGLAERDGVDPDGAGRGRARRRERPEALAEVARVERLAAAAPEHAQRIERRAEPQQRRVAEAGGRCFRGADDLAHGSTAAAEATRCHAVHTASTDGVGSPSTATCWRAPWPACGPVRHEVGKL